MCFLLLFFVLFCVTYPVLLSQRLQNSGVCPLFKFIIHSLQCFCDFFDKRSDFVDYCEFLCDII